METIIRNLDIFIKKYHFTLLLKNILFFLTLTILITIFFLFVEHTLWLDTLLRKIVFWSLLAFVLLIGIWYLLLPFVQISKFSRRIDRYKAADIIGKFFPEISDKFRNLLELNELHGVSREKYVLLEAAIIQKSKGLTVFKFPKAIDYSKLKRTLFLATPIILGMLLLTFTKPQFITEPFQRIINYNTYFEKPLPFEFVLLNDELSGLQGEQLVIEMMLRGNVIPSDASIDIEGNLYPMRKIDKQSHQYTIQQLKKNFSFRFFANGYYSAYFDVEVVVKPVILSFAAELVFPKYIQKQSEIKKNSTDFLVPEGTQINWTFHSRDVSKMVYYIEKAEKIIENVPTKKDIYRHSQIFKRSEQIRFLYSNEYRNLLDTLQMFVEVIPDNYPSINLIEARDSIFLNRIYFSGEITDDYGFTNLKFHYKTKQEKTFEQIEIPISKQLTEQRFYYMFDFSIIDGWREKEIEYYFTVSDNDGVNGAKTTKSNIRYFSMPDPEKNERNIQSKAREYFFRYVKFINRSAKDDARI
jgi:hypothetical protein